MIYNDLKGRDSKKYFEKMNNLKKVGIVIAHLTIPFLTFAAPASPINPRDDLDKQGVIDLLNTAANWFVGIVSVLAVIIILYAAFLYLTAGGDPTKTEKATKTLTYGLIGIGIAIVSYSGVAFIQSFFT